MSYYLGSTSLCPELIGQNECKRNITPVYTMRIEGLNQEEFISYGDLERFLFNKSLFTDSYLEKNMQFLRFLEAMKLPFNLESMVLYIEHTSLKKQTVSPGTVRNRKYHMKRICRELVLANPEKWSMLDQFKLEAFFDRLKPGTKQTKAIPRERILTKEEVERLLRRAPERWRYILLFLATTGVRVGELVAIIKPRCEVMKKSVQITMIGKGNKQRTIVCDRALYERITAVFPHRYYLFSTTRGTPFHRSHIWRGCHRLGMDILDRPVGVHTFRHSFATQMIEKGVELKRVSEYLGHSDSTITNDMYVHLESISIDDIPDFGGSL